MSEIDKTLIQTWILKENAVIILLILLENTKNRKSWLEALLSKYIVKISKNKKMIINIICFLFYFCP